jgi:predicted dehydrogenase
MNSVVRNDEGLSRRGFFGAASAATAAGTAASAARAAGAGGRIRIGFIGPGGQGFGSHVKNLVQLRADGAPVELVAVCDVYKNQAEMVAGFIKDRTGREPRRYGDHRELLADDGIDAVTIATPDHWHHRQIIDALRAGKHVYVEKPMTRTVEEALDVVGVWRESGRVLQVGVQATSLAIWDHARGLIDAGKLGKVVAFQTDFSRNSAMGQWRYYKLEKEMTPANIDWRRWLGVAEGLAPDMPFDRAVYRQWRCYWPFGSGMFTDLFVHRLTAMLKATGLRYPARVVGAGGIYLELDGRSVPDVATVVADYEEGCQGLISSTMCNANARIRQVIRGHHGAFDFGHGEDLTELKFIAERPQVTLDNGIKDEVIRVGRTVERLADRADRDSGYLHFLDWIEAMEAGRPDVVHNPPDLGAAAVVTVILGAMSHRNGKVYHFDARTGTYGDGGPDWAKRWEALSAARGKPRQVSGWHAGDTGSLLHPEEHQKLAGPWIDGRDPAGA